MAEPELGEPVRRLTLVLALSVAFLLLLASASTRVAAQAPVPTHAVGEAAGFGATIDIGALAKPYLDRLRTMYANNPNVTINELELTGSTDIWVYQEVTEKSATIYTIHEESAAGVKAHFVLNITSNQLPVPGVYVGTRDPTYGFCILPTIPYATRTVFLQYDVAYLDATDGNSHWNVSDFTLRDSTTNDSLDLRLASSFHGVPNSQFNETTCKETIAYMDSDLTLTANIDDRIRVAYDPALDVFNFPIDDNETWYTNATATIAGHISGTIDETGLNATQEQQYFENLTRALNSQPGISVTGLTGFPIVLEDITVTIGTVPYLQNGDIHDYRAPVRMATHATRAQMTLADGNFHTVYLLSQPPPPGSTTGPVCSFVYSPDNGFIVGYTCQVQGVAIFELKNVPPATAKDNIGRTKNDYAVNPPPTTNSLGDFFTKSPYFGILILVAVVIVVAVILMLRGRGRRPEMAPPPTTPSAAPPEGPGPPPGPRMSPLACRPFSIPQRLFVHI